MMLSPRRAGRITSSRMQSVLAMSPAYIRQLIGERDGTLAPATGLESVSKATRWGKENEPRARAAYELLTGAEVELADFVVHPELSFVGCSPDGLVGDEGLLELKCPEDPARQLWCWGSGQVWPKDRAQVQAQLWCSGRRWVDYASFDPRQPPGLDLFVVRVLPDEAYHRKLHDACVRFWSFVEARRVPEVFDLAATPGAVPRIF